jgi:preprotein translocase subunit SecE
MTHKIAIIMNLIQYSKESFEELKKRVTWPSWDEAQRITWVVAVSTLLLAGVTALADAFFNNVVQGIFKLLN